MSIQVSQEKLDALMEVMKPYRKNTPLLEEPPAIAAVQTMVDRLCTNPYLLLKGWDLSSGEANTVHKIFESSAEFAAFVITLSPFIDKDKEKDILIKDHYMRPGVTGNPADEWFPSIATFPELLKRVTHVLLEESKKSALHKTF